MKFHDLHVHTSLCNHATGTMIDYVRSGIRAGLTTLGFSDHNPLLPAYENRFRMTTREMEVYVRTIFALRERFKGEIEIKLGVELDYVSEEEDFLRGFIDKYPFDYIIGSVHYLRHPISGDYLYLSEITKKQKVENFSRYFEKIEQAAQSGLFDVVAHFDLPKKFWGPLMNGEFELAQAALETISRQGLALEINTSGLRTNGVEDSFPGDEVVRVAKELKIPFVLGSDSHAPADVGSHFPEVAKNLSVLGVKNLVSFDKRKRYEISLNSGR